MTRCAYCMLPTAGLCLRLGEFTVHAACQHARRRSGTRLLADGSLQVHHRRIPAGQAQGLVRMAMRFRLYEIIRQI